MNCFIQYLSAALIFVAALAPSMSEAQATRDFPDKPVKLIVPYAPGGGFDSVGRALADRLSGMWAQSVVVENRSGASEIVAASALAAARPDGYTLLLSSELSFLMNGLLFSKLPYSPEKDLAPVSRVFEGASVFIVRHSHPARTMKEFVALSAAHPGKTSYGSNGAGSTIHLRMHMLGLATQAAFIHIPYKGTAPAISDMLGGNLDSTWAPLPLAEPHLKAGTLRALAVTGKGRMPGLEAVPTMTELGYKDMDFNVIYGVLAPAGTPPAIVKKIAADLRTVGESDFFKVF